MSLNPPAVVVLPSPRHQLARPGSAPRTAGAPLAAVAALLAAVAGDVRADEPAASPPAAVGRGGAPSGRTSGVAADAETTPDADGYMTADHAARDRHVGRLRVDLRRLAVTGPLPRAAVRRLVLRSLPRFRGCYAALFTHDVVQGLQPTPPAGSVTATFAIAADGTVAEARATGLDEGVATCVADAIRALTFPAPRRGRGVSVRATLRFRPPAGR